MIILDSNVISEVLRPQPNLSVVTWLSRQSRPRLFTTAVTEAELRYGVERLPPGQRRDSLRAAVAGVFDSEFAGRVLAFDREATVDYADIVSTRERSGRPISQFDAQIAAITRSRRAVLATRNVCDFEGCAVELINPWNEGGS